MIFSVAVEGFDQVIFGIEERLEKFKLLRAGVHLEGAIKRGRRVRTGRDRGSWTTQERGDDVIVGTNVDYPKFVGGVGMPTGFVGAGRAHLEVVLAEETEAMMRILRDEMERGG